MALPVANMLWVEGRLGPFERACMRSVLAQGHRLVLWHYGPVDGLPGGVEQRHGGEVVPAEQVFRHVPTGSHSLFSNLFRYHLLRQGRGLWFDADMYLLAPLDWGDGHIYAFEEPGLVAIGAFALPADCPALDDLIAPFGGQAIPSWLPLRWRLRYGMQRALSGSYRIETMPWGYLGPRAVTAVLKRHGLLNRALPKPVFYPWDWRDADWIFDPRQRLEGRIAPETRAVHLYNQMIGARKDEPAPPGSFAARLHREGA